MLLNLNVDGGSLLRMYKRTSGIDKDNGGNEKDYENENTHEK